MKIDIERIGFKIGKKEILKERRIKKGKCRGEKRKFGEERIGEEKRVIDEWGFKEGWKIIDVKRKEKKSGRKVKFRGKCGNVDWLRIMMSGKIF